MTSTNGDGAHERAEAAMHLIAARALQSNLHRLTVLEGAVLAAGGGTLADDQRTAAMDIAHQLVGSAGTFGYRRVSQLARRLEFFFRDQEFVPAVVSDAADQISIMQQDLQGEPDE